MIKIKKKKICVFLATRGNYMILNSILRYIQNSDSLELILIVGAAAVLEKYGKIINLVENDGFKIDEKLYMIIEGETPETMSKSTGLGIIEFSTLLLKYKPDITLVTADRYEMLSLAIASAYCNIPIAHIQGGEVSGSIDESIRHAITKLSHIHFPANEDAKNRILQMGEDEKYIFNFGCPRIDIVKNILNKPCNIKEINKFLRTKGVGDIFNIDSQFLLFSQHPVTTEYGYAEEQINESLMALKEISKEYNLPVIGLWPNADAGSDDVAHAIRTFRENRLDRNFRFFKSIPFEYYVWLMNNTKCLIGNSSSGIREGPFIGTPVVNVGSRQEDRTRGKNVIDVDYNKENIKKAIIKQLEHDKYESEHIYGDGNASEKICKILETIDVGVKKRFNTKNFNR